MALAAFKLWQGKKLPA